MKRVLLFFSFLLCGFILQAQKVGLVLSGGGAKGMTHIGIIRALEENNIPIDYITGTSMGAIIGSLYAMGYSPDDMEALLRSPDFKRWYSDSTLTTPTDEENTTASRRHCSTVISLPTITATNTTCISALLMKT
jgi:predicted acylesterase/phospholipase RssA